MNILVLGRSFFFPTDLNPPTFFLLLHADVRLKLKLLGFSLAVRLFTSLSKFLPDSGSEGRTYICNRDLSRYTPKSQGV